MRDLTTAIEHWQRQGEQVALATVVKTWGSAPRPLGAKMVVNGAGSFLGSVSGGCVETSIVEEAVRVLASGEPKLLRFGVADEQAWTVGLSCGGEIEVFVEPLECLPDVGETPDHAR